MTMQKMQKLIGWQEVSAIIFLNCFAIIVPTAL